MRNKSNQVKNRKKRPAWVEMFAKTQSAAAETADGRDWHTDVPNIKLSRAFVVVLVLHVVAVGGILAFEMFKPDNSTAGGSQEKDKVGTLSADEKAAPGLAVEDKPEPNKTPAAEREERRGGYERYIVQAGDSIRNIADRYRIARTELLAANRIDEQHPLVSGRILRIPKALLPGGSSSNLQPVSAERDSRVATPPVQGSLPGGDLLPETAPAALPVTETSGSKPDDDGFTPIGDAPVAGETPEPDPVSTTAEATPPATPAATPAVADNGYQPANVNIDEENQRPIIVAPEVDKTKQARASRTLPGSGEPANPTTSSGKTHTVAAGETLYRISRQYGVGVDAILKANPGVKATSLGIGKSLRIP